MDIFIFRRDYRLNDNLGLIESVKNNKILPIFIFTPEQIKDNQYKSDNAIQFLCESLKDLNKELSKLESKLHIFFGENLEILKQINSETKINKIYCNKDYTTYAKKRDKEIKKIFNLELIEDYLLHPMGTLLKKDKTMYKVFTPFYNYSKNFEVIKTNNFKFNKNNFTIQNYSFEIKLDEIKKYYKINKNNFFKGGRKNGLKRLKMIDLKNYNNDRNDMTKETSYLSPYIKFGCLSIREVFYHFKSKYSIENQIFSQLYWREYYFYVINYYPDVLHKPFNTKYSNIKWKNDSNMFEAWKNGETGFPIVDASMRQLNQTGYMPNRGRLIVSNFLAKLLLVDWKKGEKYFAQKLIDYDPAVNNGNWQWISGTGIDHQPSFRILNPWTQIDKYDSKCEYIKKWVPELQNVPVKDIKNWEIKYSDYDDIYSEPIINYKTSRQDALKIYTSKKKN